MYFVFQVRYFYMSCESIIHCIMLMSLVDAVSFFIVVLHSMEKHSHFMFNEKDTVGLTTKRQMRVGGGAGGGKGN